MKLAASLVTAALGGGLWNTVVAQELPPFIQQLIAKNEASPSRSFVKIWRYDYNGETVFFLPQSPLLNDSMSKLYNSEGELICKPDGGYFGNGDGRCPDFLTTRSMGLLVWPSRAEPPVEIAG